MIWINNKSNIAIYPLTSDVFELSTDNKPDVIYAHLDVICIADGMFKVMWKKLIQIKLLNSFFIKEKARWWKCLIYSIKGNNSY